MPGRFKIGGSVPIWHVMAFILVAFVFLALGVLVGASTKRSAEHIQNREIDNLRTFLERAGPDALELRYEPEFDSLLADQLNAVLDDVAEEYRLVELRAKEWEQAADSIDDSMALVDQRGRIIRANASLADRIGVDVRQTRGMQIESLIAEREDDDGDAPMDLARRTGRLAKARVSECALGRDLEVRAQPVAQRNGSTMLLVIRDEEEGLGARRQRRLSRLVDSMPVAVLTADAVSGAVDFANDAFLRLFGFTRRELDGLRIDDLAGHEDERARLTLRTVAHDTDSGAVLLALVRADGELVFTRVFGSVIRNPLGRAEELMLVFEEALDTAVVETHSLADVLVRPSVLLPPKSQRAARVSTDAGAPPAVASAPAPMPATVE